MQPIGVQRMQPVGVQRIILFHKTCPCNRDNTVTFVRKQTGGRLRLTRVCFQYTTPPQIFTLDAEALSYYLNHYLGNCSPAGHELTDWKQIRARIDRLAVDQSTLICNVRRNCTLYRRHCDCLYSK